MQTYLPAFDPKKNLELCVSYLSSKLHKTLVFTMQFPKYPLDGSILSIVSNSSLQIHPPDMQETQ